MAKEYAVEIISVNPVYGETNSTEYFFAENAAEAVKMARRLMKNNGHTRQDGPLKYKARVAA